LLAALERGDLLAGGVLKIHGEQQGPDHETGHPGGNILTDLETLLGSELLELLIVGFDFSRNGGAIRVSILRLYNRDRLRRPPRATGDQPRNSYHQANPTHGRSPKVACFRTRFAGTDLNTFPQIVETAIFRAARSIPLD
jgi:hypothetical protein